MQCLTTNQLKKNLTKKGISLDHADLKTFKSHDYFQTINAYKYLFVSSAETIDDIFGNIKKGNEEKIKEYCSCYNINKYKDSIELENKVCDAIIKKYGINLGINNNIDTKVKAIKKIKFVKHCYEKGTNYNDFVRMFYLEHELRNVLFKYTLLIEEKIKKVFINVLNGEKEIDANYLADISNYNLSGSNRNSAISSLGMIIKMHSNKKSRPIKHKMDQELIVPYWILINEMTLGQTIQTIKNLKADIKLKILQELTNEMANQKFDITSNNKLKKDSSKEQKQVNNFLTVLNYIGEFRNDLAHNEPLYTYNISDAMKLERLKPRTDKNSEKSIKEQQYSLNTQLNSTLSKLFGTDGYNSRTYGYDIDLSWIIYVIGKISGVIKPNWKFGNEIREIFKKYNVCLTYTDNDYESFEEIGKLLDKCNSLNPKNIDLQFNGIKTSIENKKSYKAKLKKIKKELNSIYSLSQTAKNRNTKISFYEPFTFLKKYYSYTRINKDYLINYI